MIYSVNFFITGKSTTKQLANLAENDVALLYTFRLPNCGFEKIAYKPLDSLTYMQITKNCLPYSEYSRSLISPEEFFAEEHVLFGLNDYEDMESYEKRVYD